jgi:short-subunit dehydrogenase
LSSSALDPAKAPADGVGRGLGMSVAHRFGNEGYAVALVSRSAQRHADYLKSLADAGVDAAAFTADAADGLREAVDMVWRLYAERTGAEAVINALAARLRAASSTAPVARIAPPSRR